MPAVALVSMPFASPFMPSIGLSLLKAALARRTVEADVFYPAVWFADRSNHRQTVWDMIESRPSVTDLAPEWVFTEACFGPDPDMDREYMEQILGNAGGHRWREVPADTCERLAQLRAEAEPFLEHCLNAVDWGQYRVIGFTLMFHQTLASLALARRIKERHPHVLIAFGGAHCAGNQGRVLIQAFPYVDLVCSGEGDVAFPEAVARYLAGELIGRIPGIFHRGDPFWAESESTPDESLLYTQPIRDMDTLPYPDADDFFRAYTASQIGARYNVHMLFETSRGCWWGQKRPCRFCGLNGHRTAYRSKSPDRALQELRYLHDRYQAYRPKFDAVDNILDYRYFKGFLSDLKEMGLSTEIFYEVKANLTEAQVKAMAEAGFARVQPGIESLSTPILRLMNKGVTQLQCLQLLKWCRQYGISPAWNVLVGFPEEPIEEYSRMADLMPSLTHLAPPSGWGVARFDRYSTYFTYPEQFGITNLRPAPAYQYVYRGLSEEHRHNLAYYFDGDHERGEPAREYTKEVFSQIQNWRETHETSSLYSCSLDETYLYVQDGRFGNELRDLIFTGLERAVLEATHQMATPAAILRHAAGGLGQPIHHSDLVQCLQRLMDLQLLVEDEGQYLSLVIPLAEQDLSAEGQEQLAEIRISLQTGRLTA